MDERYLHIEAPDKDAKVDFASTPYLVHLVIVDGELHINVRAVHGEEASSWDDHNFVVPVPESWDG